jgi:hypothetical protein
MLSVFMLSVVMLSVIMLNVVMLSVIMLNVVMLSVIMLNVVMLNVAALPILPERQCRRKKVFRPWHQDLETKMLTDATTNTVTAICLLMIGVSQFQINVVDPSILKEYPYYLFEYFYRMIRGQCYKTFYGRKLRLFKIS